MPFYSATVAGGGAQFDGATAATGLFDPGLTGGDAIQVRINSISFQTGGVITDWTLRLLDSSGSFTPILLSDTTATFVCGGPGGFMMLPNRAAPAGSWGLTFTTTGMADPGTLVLEYEYVSTEGG